MASIEKTRNNRASLIVFAGIIAIYCALVFVLGRQLDVNSCIEWRFLTLAKILGVTVVAFGPSYFLLKFCKNRNSELALHESDNQKSAHTCSPFSIGGREKIITAACLTIPQLIVFLIMFPGMYGYDAGSHILQYINDVAPLRTQYSVIYSVFLGLAVTIGQNLGSVTIAFAVAMFIQATISVAILYNCTIFLARETASRVMWICTLAFFALFPFGLFLRVSSAQDVLFGAFFLASIIEIYKLNKKVSNNEKIKWHETILFIISSVLYMLMRNNGLYALIVAIVLSLPLIIKKRGWKMLLVLILPCAIFYLINGPIYSALGVQGSKFTIREMSSIPSQQLARAIETNRDEITDEEMLVYIQAYGTEAYGYKPEDTSWYWDQSEISDVAKERLNQNYVKNDPVSYAKLWIGIGLKCQKAYVEAFLMNSLGFWYPAKNYPDSRMYHPYIEYNTTSGTQWNPKYVDIPRSSLLPQVDEAISQWNYSGDWSRNPLSIVLKSGFYFLLFLTCWICSKYAKRNDLSIMFALCAGLIVTYFLSPVCLFRYVYPLVITAPMFFLTFFKRNR